MLRPIVAAATVAGADVEIPVRTEREVPAVVIRVVRMRDEGLTTWPDEIESGRGIRDGAFAGDRRNRATTMSPFGTGEVDEEAAARGGVGRKRHPEQALLAAGPDDGRTQIEEGRRLEHAVVEHANQATLLDDEETSRRGWVGNEGDGLDSPCATTWVRSCADRMAPAIASSRQTFTTLPIPRIELLLGG